MGWSRQASGVEVGFERVRLLIEYKVIDLGWLGQGSFGLVVRFLSQTVILVIRCLELLHPSAEDAHLQFILFTIGVDIVIEAPYMPKCLSIG